MLPRIPAWPWLWDDPECVPVERRQVLHVDVPVGLPDAVEQLTAVLARLLNDLGL